ncbi:MAG: AraC family transcriptional regulator [Roseburia sp.]|nr:AraC family transcriptional regulator [Roseburia sp.]MCM1099443.1 AraC family transcriptional regulator [Ruminococcus flavefaciens]
MDYHVFSSLFFASSHLPLAYVKQNAIVEVYGIAEELSPFPGMLRISSSDRIAFPYVFSHESGYYGILKPARDEASCLLIGPAFTTRLTDEMLYEYMRENAILHSRKEEVRSALSLIPTYTYYRFLNLIIFLEYTLNNRRLDLTADFHISDEIYNNAIAASQVEAAYSTRDLHLTHGTYYFEQQIMSLIKSGKRDELKSLLLQSSHHQILNEGSVAQTPLRQAKNVFIAMVAQVGKEAAIPGGLDIEQTYQLIDQYSQECELLQSVEAVTTLQYNMLLDFAARVSETQIPAGISPEVYSCIQFINSHVNEVIGLQDVADFIHKSRAYTVNHFKDELGFNVGEYITHARIQEAKSLLRYTDKSLSEISAYLCYSSQSYFQNVFKKIAGETPLEYRKRAGR